MEYIDYYGLDFFKQNAEFTHEENPLVDENVFIKRKECPEDSPVPTFDEARDRLPVPHWDGHEDYVNCYWKAWEIGFKNVLKIVPNTGFVSNFIDTAFNGCIFMWDSSFMLMFGKYADRIFKFQKTLDNFYSHQHIDGFICREIEEWTGKDHFTRHDPSATGPDIMTWCEWEYYLNFGDKERLGEVFIPLMAYHRWMRENHTWRDGTYFSTGWGCGMDNIRRVEPCYSRMYSHGHAVWVDACMQELNNCNILIEIARIVGREEFIPELCEERDLLKKAINEKLWDEETGFYYDLWRGDRKSMVKHIGAYWGLLAGCADEDRAEKLIAHLENENEFKTPNRVPALSGDMEEYHPDGGYWRGGVWPPTNYMVLKGLDKYGKFDLSHEIACDYLYSVIEVYKQTDTLFENYAPEFVNGGKPWKGEPAKPNFVGWSGLGPISILFEYVFGIKSDAQNNKITWHVNLLERHGIEKYPFGTEGTLTLMCEARESRNDIPKITVDTNVPVTVEVIYGEKGNKNSFVIESSKLYE